MDLITLALAKKYSKQYTDNAVEGLGFGFSYKGSVLNSDELPNYPSQGDEYTVKDTKSICVWDGEDWFYFNSIRVKYSSINSGNTQTTISLENKDVVLSVLLTDHVSNQQVFADVTIENDGITITLKETYENQIDIKVFYM